MFLVPLQCGEHGPQEKVPAVNAILVAINVLVFWLGWSMAWSIHPGSGLLSLVTAGFAHANLAHLVGNMWILLVIGNAVNRRLGNYYYFLTYMGILIAEGMITKLIAPPSNVLGASGVIYGVIALCILLLPRAPLKLFCFATFPFTFLVGLVRRPNHWIAWLLRFDSFEVAAYWCIVLFPLNEIWKLIWLGWNWSNVFHLVGFICGVGAVLVLPKGVSMPERGSLASAG